MKKLITVLISVIVAIPNIANAKCLTDGFTVVFVNGILKTETEANTSTLELQRQFAKYSDLKNVKFKTGYNPTHLAGAGDLAQAASQLFGYSVSDFDLQTILKQIHPEVTTRKLFLVGHS